MDKKIGLALSGGGARGIAHIGIIEVLQEMGIKPSLIAGTSAGAIVGALFGRQLSPERMLDFFRETNLFHISHYALFEPGIINSQKFAPLLEEFIEKDSFEDLDIPLVVPVTDLLKGTSEIFESGPLFQVLLASAAYPGAFTPVKIDEMLCADGGILNNLPARLVRERCDVVIGINVNPIDEIREEDLDSTFDLMKRAIDLKTRWEAHASREYCDYYIYPKDLAQYNIFSMNHIDEIYEIGKEEVKKEREKLEKILD